MKHLSPAQRLVIEDVMMGEGLERYPPRWYENLWLVRLLPIALGVGFYLLARRVELPEHFLLTGLGILVYLAGAAADLYATAAVTQLKPEYDRRGLEFPTEETNWLLPKHPTMKQMIFSPTGLVFLAALVMVYYLWWTGVAVGLAQLLAAQSNWRQYQRYRFGLQLLENRAFHFEQVGGYKMLRVSPRTSG